jgi:uncharacterized surface protein with fasciclin (FAS1) repeats
MTTLNKFKSFIAVFLIAGIVFANNNTVDKDIVETAVSAGSFNTLAKALQEADLVDALKEDGPYTVFAPTDEAFAKLPEGTLENLLEDKEALQRILLYHVVSGKYTSKDVVELTEAATLAKANFSINVSDGKVKVNDSNVISTDIETTNGVIHVIDTVLLPPSEE